MVKKLSIETDYQKLLTNISNATYSKKSIEQIIKYNKKLTIEEKSTRTKYLYLNALNQLAKLFPKQDLLSLSLAEDIGDYKLWLQKQTSGLTKKKYSPYTVQYYLTYVKTFYLNYLDEGKVRKELKFIKKSTANLPHKLEAHEYLTHDDILSLVNAAQSKKQKAMIYVGWESALRASSFTKVKLGDLIQLSSNGKDTFRIRVRKEDIKGQREQCVPVPILLYSVPYLLQWLEEHQFKSNPDAPLFYRLDKKTKNPVNHNSAYLNVFLKRTASKTNIKKKMFWHGLRHSHTKFLRDSGYADHIIKRMHGLSEKSHMLEVYSRFDEKDTMDYVFKKEGLSDEKELDNSRFEPRVCPRCQHNNLPDAKYCKKCWLVLDAQEALEFETKSILSDNLQEMVNKAVEKALNSKK